MKMKFRARSRKPLCVNAAIDKNKIIKSKKSNLDYARGISPKRVAGSTSAAQRLGNTAQKKRRRAVGDSEPDLTD